MFMKTSLYSLAALALCFIFAPAQAQSPFDAPPPAAPATAPADAEPPAESAAEEPVPATEEAPVSTGLPETATTIVPPSNKPSFYDPEGTPYSKDYFEDNFEGIRLALQHDPSRIPGQFNLHISVSQPSTSCIKFSNPSYTTTMTAGTMEVVLGKRTVDKRNMPRYAHFECDLQTQESAADLPLSKELIRDNNISKIRFRGQGIIENYDVKLTDEFVQLTPSQNKDPALMRFTVREVTNLINPLRLWFYPENTVILTAEGAHDDVVLAGELKSLAQRLGLEPLETMMPNFKSPRKKPDGFYFVDTKGRYPNANGELLDYVQADVMKFGLEADEPAKENIAVFIRKPGQYD